jgi:enoyl-CoA hydratase/carnithine racemase
MTFDFLVVTTQHRVRTVRLNRLEKRNALSMKLRDELESCFTETDRDDDVAVAVLTGGNQVFSAGFDLQEVVSSRFETFGYRAREFNQAVHGFSKPLVTAVSGPALAGGFDLALAGDIIVASETARFGHPEVNFGAAPGLAVLWTRVGVAKARELAMLDSTISADEAYRIGLINRLVPVERLMEEALDVARQLADKPPVALRAVKAASRQVAAFEMFAAMQMEEKLAADALRDPENIRRAETYMAELKGNR